MKKIQERVNKIRKILILTSVVTANAVFLPGCDLFAYKQPFPDAYYTSNFIEAIGFDVFEGDNAVVPAVGSDPVTGKWDFAYRYSDWDTYPYMSLHVTDTLLPVPDPGLTVAAFDSVPVGLSTSAPVYRLELVNLIEGGDFEELPAPSETWIPGTIVDTERTNVLPLFGSFSRKIKADQGTQIAFSPSLVSGLTIDSNATYLGIFNTTKTIFDADGNVIETPDGYGVRIVGSENWSPNTSSGITKGTFSGVSTTPEYIFSPLSGLSFSDIRVDNFKLTKSGGGGMKLRLLLSPQLTNPILESGVYSFSIWVHDDPLAFTYRSPYKIDEFTIALSSVDLVPPAAASVVYDSSVSGWQKITAILASQALQFDDTASVVLELSLLFENVTPGRVLLAQPELRSYPHYPDGL